MKTLRYRIGSLVLAIVAVCVLTLAQAAEWPSSTITIVVPTAPGGGTDLSARTFAKYAKDELGVQMIVMNVPGGGSYNGTKKAHDSAPDGNTILFSHNTVIANYITGIAPYSFDGFEVGPRVVSDTALGLFVNTKFPAKDMKEFVEYAKAHPGQVSSATEIGATTYFLLMSLQEATGIELKLVDAGNNAERATALLGGHIDSMPNSYGTVQGYVKSGDFRSLGFTGKKRNAVFPDIPTCVEQGVDFVYPGYEFSFFFPKGTPVEILEKFDAAAEKIVNSEGYKKDILKLGFEAKYLNRTDNYNDYKEMQELYTRLAADMKK